MRNTRRSGVAEILVGLALIGVGLVSPGIVRFVIVFALLLLFNAGWRRLKRIDYLVVKPDMVTVTNPATLNDRTTSIDGLGDLALSSSTLVRRSDGKKIARLRPFFTQPADVAALRAALPEPS